MNARQIGRFVVLSRIGAGAMGEVWSAHDPKLDRRVAIKLIRGTGDGDRRARLVREAQALARLSHPNVVQVFEVGTEGDEVYVAMEQIDGPTLRQWLAKPRTRGEVLAMFAQAGRGLAAAHAVGLVHRDFKLDNVLVGADGRARVVDFGLARASGPADELPLAVTHESDPVLFVELTSTGEVLGTPAYMAPEQFLGETVDARSDQFAFCVALFEVLYGVRPFAGATRMALAHAITSGQIVTPPPGRDVSPWLHRAMIQGLAVDPTARHADVPALLAAIAGDPTPRKRRLIAGALLVAMIGVPLTVVGLTRADGGPCAAGPTALGEVWSASQRDAFVERLTTRTIPTASIEAAAARLDTYGSEWLAAHREACEATHVTRTQSGEQLDQRMRCLGRRRTAFTATIAVLADADADAITRADAIIENLPSIPSCSDATFVGTRDPIDDPQLARTVEAIEADIARSHALHAAGSYALARGVAQTAFEQATAAGHADSIAAALHARGLAERADGDARTATRTLEESVWTALAANGDDTAYGASLALIEIVGHQLRDDAGAEPWIRQASALVDSAAVDPQRRWQLHLDVGTVHWTHARLADAEREFEAALVVLGDVDAHDHRETRILNNLGAVALEREDYARAQYLFMRCLTSDVARVGPEHLNVSDDLGNLGTVAFRLGDFAMARAWFERSLARRRKQLGEQHPQVIGMLGNLAGAHLGAGEIETGVVLLREQITAWETRPGERNPAYHATQHNLAIALMELGRPVEAITFATDAAIGLTVLLGAMHPSTAAARGTLQGALEAARYDADTVAVMTRARTRAASDSLVLALLDDWLGKSAPAAK